MNIFSVTGFILAIVVLITGLLLASEDIRIFIDYPSMFIVFGGTLAATAISFQLNRIGVLFKIFFRIVIKGKTIDYSKIIREMMQIGEAHRSGTPLEELVGSANDFFLKEALELLSDGLLKEDEAFNVLEHRMENIHFHHDQEANKIKGIAKFPPAFGMMGTTIGMIVLLSNLAGTDAIKKVGPAMSVCLITTLYGIVIANLVFLPVAENLLAYSSEVALKNKIILEGLKLTIKKTNPVVMAEKLNSFLAPQDRLNWKETLSVN